MLDNKVEELEELTSNKVIKYLNEVSRQYLIEVHLNGKTQLGSSISQSRKVRQLVAKVEKQDTVELQWLEHLWNHENIRDRGSSSE